MRHAIASVPIQKFLCTFGLHVEGTAAEALDRGQNVVGRLGPAKRLRVGVLSVDEALDVGDQLLDRLVGSTLDLFVGEQRKEALDLIEP